MGRKRKSTTVTVDVDFTKKSWKEDLALIVDGKRLYVSRAVLALESPVFCAMFEGDFMEKNEAEIELKEKTYKDILEFMQCLYPGVRKPVTAENVFTVLALAEEYQVNTVKSECEKCLLQELTNPHKSANFYCRTQRVSSLFNLPEVEEACIEQLSKKRMKEVKYSEKSYPLPIHSKNKLLTEMNTKLEDKIEELQEKVMDIEEKMDKVKEDSDAKDEKLLRLMEKENILESFQSFFGQENDYLIQGTITLTLDDASGLSIVGRSVDRRFRGFTWRLTVRKNVVDGIEYLSVWFSVIAGPTPRPLKFRARVKYSLKSIFSNEETNMEDVNYFSSAPTKGIATWLKWQEFTSPRRGFIQNNTATVELYAMFHSPVPA